MVGVHDTLQHRPQRCCLAPPTPASCWRLLLPLLLVVVVVVLVTLRLTARRCDALHGFVAMQQHRRPRSTAASL